MICSAGTTCIFIMTILLLKASYSYRANFSPYGKTAQKSLIVYYSLQETLNTFDAPKFKNDSRVRELLRAFHHDCQLDEREVQELERLERSDARRKPLIVVEGTDRDSEVRTSESIPTLNLGTDGFTCPPKRGQQTWKSEKVTRPRTNGRCLTWASAREPVYRTRFCFSRNRSITRCRVPPARRVVAKKLGRNIGALLMSSPPACLNPMREHFGDNLVLRRAYFSLCVYAGAINVTRHWYNHTIVMYGYWHDQATFSIAKKYNELTMPPADSPVFDWPEDLIPPDVEFFINTPRSRSDPIADAIDTFRPRVVEAYRRMRNPNVFEITGNMYYDQIRFEMEIYLQRLYRENYKYIVNTV